MSEAFERLKEEFLGETEETLATFRADLLRLGSGTPLSSQATVVDRAFRTAHSLKGVLGMFGLDAMSRVAHSVESVLEEIREARLPADPATMDVLLQACETLHALLAKAGDARQVPPESVDDLVLRLDERLADAVAPPIAPDDPLRLALAALSDAPVAALAAAHSAGDSIALIELRPEDPDFSARFVATLRALREWGTVHGVFEVEPNELGAPLRLRVLVSGRSGIFTLARAVRPHGGETLPCDAERWRRARAASTPTLVPATRIASPRLAPLVEATPDTPAAVSTLRVRIERVDRLLQALAGILQSKNELDEAAVSVLATPKDRMLRTALSQSLRSLDRKIRDLQREVLGVRLVAIGSLFPKLERVAWSAAREAEKEMKFEATGGEVEVDKEIVDGLLSPLIHLVRNAVDHGIDGSETRRSRGKDAAGSIRLVARSEGGTALVEICDDGAGIDLERVLERARARGLLQASGSPSPAAILEVLFHPGFTTRDNASSLSGRGVGLDAVKDSIGALGGTVDIESDDGGTTVRLRVPVSRAILSGLLVRAAGQTFVLPVASVARVVKVWPGQVEDRGSGETIVLEGREIPVEDLGRIVGFPRPRFAMDSETGLLLEWSGRRALVLVDDVGARRDVVAQGLGIVRGAIPGVAGSTELGDGRTLLLLDPATLLDSMARRRRGEIVGV